VSIAVRGLHAELEGTPVLHDVDLEVPSGAWAVLVGPNGAGKTTLLRAVAGLLRPRAGDVLVRGESVAGAPRRALARRVALVPQRPALPGDMTVREHALLGRTAHLGPLGREGRRDHEAVEAALARLALLDLADRRLAQLSGGERQRAVLARAVAQAAPVLLLDEPTSALDLGHQQNALDLVAALRREGGLTVLGAMHDLTLAGQYADRLVLLDGGRVVREGRPAEVLDEPLVARHLRARVRVVEVPGAGRVVAPAGARR
jgi:iron complex transport system ATP-binding protein